MIFRNKCTDIYPKELAIKLKFNTKYIPRHIDTMESLSIYHKYWIDELRGFFKLTNIQEYFHVKYYFLESKNTNQLYTYPINDSNFYELMNNNKNIHKEDIINTDNIYNGYEIKYWFYKNWSKKLIDFSKYIKLDGTNPINDNKKYKVTAVYINNLYRNCKIIECS